VSAQEDRPLEDLLGVRELFREEARAILDRLRRRLPELERGLPDGGGLGDVVADGVALKGSAALVGLAVVSQAGVLVVRAAELAAERASEDPAGATALVAALRASLAPLERLFDVCLDGGHAEQDALLAEALDRFTPRDRSVLRTALEAPSAGPVAPAREPVVAEAVAGLVTALTDLLIADTQLGGVEQEIDALVAASEASNAKETPIMRRVADALAARAAPARALARSAGELHRWVRRLEPAATPLETLVRLHVGEASYALAAEDVEGVAAVAHATHLDEAGRATLSFEGGPLPALDLARYLGGAGSAAPAMAAVVRADGARFALLVTRVEPPRLMVVRPLDALLSRHPLARAATIGARGEVVFVLRATALLDALRSGVAAPAAPR
jgi:chemotaxis protein histidine kinase CheA